MSQKPRATTRFAGILARRGKGDRRRWAEDTNFMRDWGERTALLAGRIPDGTTVLDLGAGLQALRGQLPAGCKYIPLDITARTPDTIVCDLSQRPRPVVEADWCIASGLMEYVDDPADFLRWCNQSAPDLALSYAPVQTRSLRTIVSRMRTGWINHLTLSDLRATLENTGYVITDELPWNRQVCLWATTQPHEVALATDSAPGDAARLTS